MKIVNVVCPAKVGLFYSNNNGNRVVVNDTVNIYDKIAVSLTKHLDNQIIINNKKMVYDKNNLVYKIINDFFNDYSILKYQYNIVIDKKIPSGFGFNGTYSDIAGIIMALNDYLSLNLSKETLVHFLSKYSPDIAYFIDGHHQIIKNNTLEKLPDLNVCYLVLLTNFMHEKITNNENVSYNGQYYNQFDNYTSDELKIIKDILLKYGSLGTVLNGEGKSVVSVFDNIHDRFNANKELEKQKIKTKICIPSSDVKMWHSYL